MLNQASEWSFINKPSRPPLSKQEAQYWKQLLSKLLKVGIEIELNLPEKNGSCDRQNFLCQCVATFKPEKPMPNTSNCYEQCKKWDNGNCAIAKEHGCAGIYCRAFESPCPSCSKYDRGCNSCPELYNIKKDPRYIREAVGKLLEPTRFVGATGRSGTYKVCRDGSLLGDGGIEVATVGRRVQFGEIYNMINQIMGSCQSYGAYVNERCSIHIHLLASYLTPGFNEDDLGSKYIQQEVTELERPMPEIILANYHQLIRKYHCALIWLSASGEQENSITRWEKFRKSILPYSAVKQRMPLVVQEVGSASKSKRKYALMNYEQMKFDEQGRVSRLHVEGRYMDGNLSPATVAAHACLLYGLMLKAVEISQYGVLQSGNKDYMDMQREIYKHLSNNDGGWDANRHSDNSGLKPYITDLKKQSLNLIRLVKNTLRDQSPADEILTALAEKPLAYRRMEKKGKVEESKVWTEIEKELLPAQAVTAHQLKEDILRLVDLGAICECESSDEWVEAATHQLSADQGVDNAEEKVVEMRTSIQEYVKELERAQRITWSDRSGGFMSSY